MKDAGDAVRGCHDRPSAVLRNLWMRLTKLSAKCDPESVIQMFYTWITAHIQYDVQLYKTLSGAGVSDQVVSARAAGLCPGLDAVTSGKALCLGFTDLLYHLCSYSNIKCVKIDGHVKGVGYLPGDDFDMRRPNHQWLAVYVESEWRLLDPVWDCGYVDRLSGRFVSRVTSRHFLGSPRQFILDHLPLDRKWQLLDSGPDLVQFASQPLYGQAFSVYGFSSTADSGVVHMSTEDTYRFDVSCDPNKLKLTHNTMRLIVRDVTSGLMVPDLGILSTDQITNTAHISVTSFVSSTFLVELYVNDVTEKYCHVISVRLVVTSPKQKPSYLHIIKKQQHSGTFIRLSDITQNSNGQVVLNYRSTTDLHLKIILYNIINGRLIRLKGHVINNDSERKLLINIRKSGAYKVVIYGKYREVGKTFMLLYMITILVQI